HRRSTSVFVLTPLSPRSPLFPYTTLFRSIGAVGQRVTTGAADRAVAGQAGVVVQAGSQCHALGGRCARRDGQRGEGLQAAHRPRSEEHTSELQSREKLVCRLLLEKKKKKK